MKTTAEQFFEWLAAQMGEPVPEESDNRNTEEEAIPPVICDGEQNSSPAARTTREQFSEWAGGQLNG